MAVQYIHQINLTDVFIKKQTSHTITLFLIRRNIIDINLINIYRLAAWCFKIDYFYSDATKRGMPKQKQNKINQNKIK